MIIGFQHQILKVGLLRAHRDHLSVCRGGIERLGTAAPVKERFIDETLRRLIHAAADNGKTAKQRRGPLAHRAFLCVNVARM
jgi:hypothetical protein